MHLVYLTMNQTEIRYSRSETRPWGLKPDPMDLKSDLGGLKNPY